MSELDDLRDYIDHKINGLHSIVDNLQLQNELLTDRIVDLEEKKKARAKKDLTNALKFKECKEEFINNAPYDRDDPFTDWELVLWQNYLLFTNKLSGERITTFEELYKRASKAKIVVEHFIEMAKHALTINSQDDVDKIWEDWARKRAKDYFEYVTLAVKLPENKQYDFYYIASQWALNEFGDKIGSWQQIKTLEDRPAE